MSDLPSYPLLRAHHDPEWGQAGVYRYITGEEAGEEYPCIVHQVDIPKDPINQPEILGHSEDGKYWNVSVSVLWPGNWPHPGEVRRKAGIFWKSGEFAGKVTSGTCGPGWPG